MKHAVIIISVCICSFQLYADDEKKISKRSLIEQADYYFFKEDFPTALELYGKILNKYPKEHYIQYHQYVAYHLTYGRGTELNELKEFEKNEGQTDKFYNYWLGRIHYNRYEFDMSIKHFKAFLALDVYRTKEIIKESEERLAQSKRAQSFYKQKSDFAIKSLAAPINSEFADLSPAFFADHRELLFVSTRQYKIDTSEHDVYRVFHSKRNADNSWTVPTRVESIDTLHEKSPRIEVVNQDGKLFLYNQLHKDLYYSEPKEQGWTRPQEFDVNLQGKHIESHFFISDSEDLIFFSGKSESGNLDIYYSKKDLNGQGWSTPLPVNGQVNSNFDEDSPFMSHDGKTLYFSSNRPEAIGGFDIFKSDFDPKSNTWGSPVNLGFPINTIDDEINFELNPDNISGFLSSNRLHGQGDFDIYHFHKTDNLILSGTIFDKNKQSPLNNLELAFRPKDYPDQIFSTITNDNGGYQIEISDDEDFIVEFGLQGARFAMLEFKSVPDHLRKSVTKNFEIILPDRIEQQADFAVLYNNQGKESQYENVEMLGSKFRTGQKAMIRNIYFELHSAKIESDHQHILDKLLKTMETSPNLRIEIEGHTDSTGGQELNLQLSKARAETVKSYLVERGIASSRITTVGYGAAQPLASNDDEEDGRELNRRIEVVALE